MPGAGVAGTAGTTHVASSDGATAITAGAGIGGGAVSPGRLARNGDGAGAAPIAASVVRVTSAVELASGTIAGAVRTRVGAGGTDGVGAGPPATRCSLGACGNGPATGATAGAAPATCAGTSSETQIGYLDPSRLPGEAETRKPCSLATEHQAQQQRVYQQREQQRVGQSPLLGTHALAVGASLEPVEFNRDPPSLHGHCCLRGAGSHRVRRACRPDGPVGHDLAKVPPRHLRTASGPWSRRLPSDLGVDSHMSERTVEATRAIAHGFCAPMSRANQSGALDAMFELGTSARDAPCRQTSVAATGRPVGER